MYLMVSIYAISVGLMEPENYTYSRQYTFGFEIIIQ